MNWDWACRNLLEGNEVAMKSDTNVEFTSFKLVGGEIQCYTDKGGWHETTVSREMMEAIDWYLPFKG